jgi:hypothetical protein
MRKMRTFSQRNRIPAAGVAALLFALVTAGMLQAQVQQFGGYSYMRPTGYTERASGNHIELTKVDAKRRTFCQLGLQLSQTSLGSTAKDLDTEWQLLVANQFKLNGPAVTTALSVRGGSSEGVERAAPTSTTNVASMISTVMLLRFRDRYVSLLANATNAEALPPCRADAMELLATIRLNEAAASVEGGSNQPPVPTGMPIGNTPQLFPGMPGWLPSGTGLPIPQPGFNQGMPVGLWWKAESDRPGSSKATVHVFLTGGIRASAPRLGGPYLFDMEGQNRQHGNTGVGTYAIESGQFVQRYDGFENKGAYSTGSDSTGPYFKSGVALYRPLEVVTTQSIAGHWRGNQSEISFRADGTYLYGPPAAGNVRTGKYRLSGYLIQMLPDNGPPVIDRVGIGGGMLVIGSSGVLRVN